MLKPILRDQTISVVSIADPAFDLDGSEQMEHEGEAILAYARERFTDPASWRTLLKTKDGEQPTEFLIGIIPPAEVARIEDECKRDVQRWSEQCWRAFSHSLVGIEAGFDVKDVPRIKVDNVQYIAPSWIRETFIASLYHVAVEVGAVAWHWNRMVGSDLKNSSGLSKR